MKIRKGTSRPPCYPNLGSISDGKVVRFPDPVHQKHEPWDVFIVNEICSSYTPDRLKRQRPRAVGVTNLRTGSLAYLDATRAVEVVDAEVCLL